MTTSTEPEPLYHYTSQKGLLGILQNHKLRMTNILYMNDSNEFSHPMDFLKTECLRETLNILLSMRMKIPDYSGHKTFKEEIYLKGMNIFVFSLSEKGNDLSQWRGYCPDTGGFCIEFDREKLFNIVEKKEHLEIKECSYMTNEMIRERLDSLLTKSTYTTLEGEQLVEHNYKDVDVSEINKILYDFLTNRMLNLNDISRIDNILNELIKECPFWKDKSFQDEKECRIIYRYEGEGKDIKFDEGKSMIKPYYEIEFKGDDKLPISKIIVGPTPHPELSKLSVESLLKSEKYEGVEVEISKIPYRSW